MGDSTRQTTSDANGLTDMQRWHEAHVRLSAAAKNCEYMLDPRTSLPEPETRAGVFKLIGEAQGYLAGISS